MSVVDENADARGSEVVSVSAIKAVPIVLMNETPQLDLNQLKRIFAEYKDHLVAVISVFGVQRSGKSFLLNLLCHYLMENQSSDWFKQEHSKLVNVFHWKGGTKAHTSGIHITDKPFMLENDHGQKVAVFLMDTQGSFDKGMTAAECSFIAALSTSLSSVQIYNLKGGLIDESDLQLLQIFLNHARAIIETEQGEENDRTSQFQCLLFLIRNWQMPDYDYGSKGGLEYLEEVMNTDQAENKDVRKKIRESFADVRCHLLEHPGKKVAKLKDSKLDKIKVLDIDKDFLEGVDDLAKCLFSKDSLVVKKLNGKACTGKDLMKVAKQFKKRVESGDAPKVNTPLKDSEIAEFHRKKLKIEEKYEKSMTSQMGGKYIESKMLEQLHKDCLKDALKKYDKLKHDMLDEGQRSRYRTQVEQYLEIFTYQALKHKNNAQREREINFIIDQTNVASDVYLKEMIKIAGGHYLEDVYTARAEAEKKAIEAFIRSTSDRNQDLVQECGPYLHVAIQSKHEEFERRNAIYLILLDEDLDRLDGEVTAVYVNCMDQVIIRNGTDDELELAHQDALNLSTEKFNESKIGKGLQLKEKRLQSLNENIMERFQTYVKVRRLQLAKQEKQLKLIEEKQKIVIKCTALVSEYSARFKKFESKYVEDGELYQVNERAKRHTLKAYHEFKREVALSAFDVYEQYERKIKQDFEETFNKVKENNENNKRNIERKLSAFYGDLASDYITTMKKASSIANKMTMDKLHKKFKKSVIEEIRKAVLYKNIQENAIVACGKKLQYVHYDIAGMWFAALENTAILGGVIIGASAGVVFGPIGTVVGMAVGVLAGTTYVVAKNVFIYLNLNISELPSIIYLKSLNL